MKTEHTLFSPIDSAFTRMSKENQNRLINDAEFRRDFIRSHLIKGRIRFDGISSGQQLIIHNLNGQKLHLIAYPNGVRPNFCGFD